MENLKVLHIALERLAAKKDSHTLLNILPPRLTTLHMFKVEYHELLESTWPHLKTSDEASDTYLKGLMRCPTLTSIKELRILYLCFDRTDP
jgi:hypothetical protein